ncbi:hypothetical protein ACYTKI_003923 [Escherichia albertii]|uniref:hypothetical protein n=1 Tax=Escherichia albertii TaxID=208962 RepID=UPI00223F4EFB|nr:hypothetical protein [Escherichia albertii]QTA10910.1 hypothetical protein FYK20_07985 [Escherichia albertii]WDB52920.1 hypothetical protein PS037_02835 [Escherichia albertii]
MKNKLKKIEKPWEMESVSEPFFNYDDNGLEIYFLVFLGEAVRVQDINTYKSLNMLKHENDIPDRIYNNAGFRMLSIKFDFFDSFYCTDKNSALSDYIDGVDFSPGFYERMNEKNERLGYVFIGHDLFISVKASGYFEYISNSLQRT